MRYEITVDYTDDGQFVVMYDDERKARAFINEELKWETTKRVRCPSLLIDQAGDFASFTNQGETK
jgi:glycerophosphoryl diester phosphodiesterase